MAQQEGVFGCGTHLLHQQQSGMHHDQQGEQSLPPPPPSFLAWGNEQSYVGWPSSFPLHCGPFCQLWLLAKMSDVCCHSVWGATCQPVETDSHLSFMAPSIWLLPRQHLDQQDDGVPGEPEGLVSGYPQRRTYRGYRLFIYICLFVHSSDKELDP